MERKSFAPASLGYYVILSVLFCVSFNMSVAQLTSRVIPPSPEAASLGKYGDYPVSKYTGVPEISIPLFNIQAKDVDLPVTLSYHSSGIKVEEEASMVGLGWSLNYGGVITRTMRGGDDLQSVSDPKNIYAANSHGEQNYDGYPFDPEIPNPVTSDYIRDICETDIDPEPDIFYFNFFGNAGKFILPKGQNITSNYIIGKPLNKENIDIAFNRSLLQWEVWTKDGFLYLFKTIEMTQVRRGTEEFFDDPKVEYKNSEDLLVSSWYLNKVISPLGEEINIVYDVLQSGSHQGFTLYGSSKRSQSQHASFAVAAQYHYGSGCIKPYQHFYTEVVTLSTLVYPKEIIFSSGKVVFYKSSRDDIQLFPPNATYHNAVWQMSYPYSNPPREQPPQRIDSISFFNKNNILVKKVKLKYDYFNSQYTGNEPGLHKRLKLKGLELCGPLSGGCAPPYKFSYDERFPLPSKLSFAQDFWGYYNGKFTNTSPIPRGIYKPTPQSTPYYLGTADRFPDLQYAQAGILKSIAFPTGGSTSFEYELNDYSEYGDHGFRYLANSAGEAIGSEIELNAQNIYARSASGLRVIKISTTDDYGSIQNTYFNYTSKRPNGDRESSGKLMMLPNFHSLLTGSIAVGYCSGEFSALEAASWSNVTLGTSAGSSIVGYNQVTVRKTGVGSSIFKYLNQVEVYPEGYYVVLGVPNITHNSNGLPESEFHLSETGDTLSSIKYHYSQQIAEKIYGCAYNITSQSYGPYGAVGTCLNWQPTQLYYHNADRWVLSQKLERSFHEARRISVITSYEYDTLSHLQLESQEKDFGNGQTSKVVYKYPKEAEWIPSSIWSTHHITGIPVEETTLRNNTQEEKIKRFYSVTSGKPHLDYMELYARDSQPVYTQNFEYDQYWNLIRSEVSNDLSTVFVWGYNRTQVVAKIVNASPSEVFTVINESQLQTMDDQVLRNHINQLRTALPNSQVYTYTHFPQVGVKSITDSNGVDRFYEYDEAGRLSIVKDVDGNIVERIDYNFKNGEE